MIPLEHSTDSHALGRPPGWATAERALSAAAGLWFLAAVAGQWAFVYYIVSFYGPPTLSGDFAAWDRNPGLTDGYLAGDLAGNLVFVAHMLVAAVLTFGGALQLVPSIRDRVIAFHRWNGRVFLVAAITGALGGLYLEWVRGTGLRAPSGLINAVAITVNAMLILAFVGLAWRAVRDGRIDAHRRWATRLFLVVNGVWFLRVGVRAWLILTGGGFGGQVFFDVWVFGCYLVPLAVYELYLRARTAAAPARFGMAVILLALTVAMGVGTVTMFVRKWLPLVLL